MNSHYTLNQKSEEIGDRWAPSAKSPMQMVPICMRLRAAVFGAAAVFSRASLEVWKKRTVTVSGSRRRFLLISSLVVISLAGLLMVAAPKTASAATISVPSFVTSSRLTRGLVGWWTFDGKDMVNGVAKDRSGNGNNGNLVNIATSTFYTAGKIGQGLNFLKTTNYMTAGDTASLRLTSAGGAVSFWMYLKDSPTGALTYDTVISKNQWSSDRNGFSCYFSVNNVPFRCITSNASAFQNSIATTLTNTVRNKWTHVVFSWDGTYQRLFINGIKEGADVAVASGMDSTGYPLRVGMNADTLSSTYAFKGIIDDVRIYNRALSAAEVAQLYKTTAGNKQSVSNPAAGNLAAGLVGYWTFDGKDMTTGAVKDMSGNGNTGNLVNMSTSTSRVPGKIGQALQFDGVNDWVSAGNAVSLQPGQNYTMSAWFKPSDITNTFNYIVSYGAAGQGTHSGMNIEQSSVGYRVDIRAKTDTSAETASTGFTIKNGIWYHAVAVRTGAVFSLYINGVFFTSMTLDTGAITDTTGILIGTEGVNPTLNNFPGTIDDVRIYNRALSAAEVAQLYKTTAGNKQSVSNPAAGNLAAGLVGYWTFDGKDMTTGAVKDMSGNGNTGNLVNMSTSTSRVPGKIGQALQFDGVNDYVDAGNVLDKTTNYSLSISAWVNYRNIADSDIVSKDLGNGTYAGYIFEIFSNRIRFAEINNNPSAWLVIDSQNSYNDGKWHHVLVTEDSTGTAAGTKIYVDGILVPMTTVANTLSGSITNNANFRIGKRFLGSTYFGGLIDDVRIYNRALSAAEIQQLYNLGH